LISIQNKLECRLRQKRLQFINLNQKDKFNRCQLTVEVAVLANDVNRSNFETPIMFKRKMTITAAGLVLIKVFKWNLSKSIAEYKSEEIGPL
jgi:hypothetical protein